MTKLSKGRTYSTNGPECPQCGFTFTPDEGSYYDEQNYTEDLCQECESRFKVEVYHSTSWTCTLIEPAPAEPEALSAGQRGEP